MGDLISRTEVINAIDEREDVNGNVNAEDIRTDICLIPSKSGKGEWIPVSERLPKERQAVLCWAESTAERLDTEFIGMYDNGVWFLQSDANHLSYPHQYNVVAWQPLPEPYKAEKGGE